MERGLLVVPAVLAAAVVLAVLAARRHQRQAAAHAAAAARELVEGREREEALIRTVEQLSDANPERHGLRAV
jgi:Flp pilus assembly protein protease CpaA